MPILTPGNVVFKQNSVLIGLLDRYAGAIAAYSLRELTWQHADKPVVRVRRSSDNSEQDFTASQVTNGTLATFCMSGDGFVQTWYDQSGNEKHATQTSTESQPSIVSSGNVVSTNSKPAIVFSSKFMISAPTLPTIPQKLSFVLVHDPLSSVSTGQAPISFGGGSRDNGIIIQQNVGLQPTSPKIGYPLSQSLILYEQNTAADYLYLNQTLTPVSQISTISNSYVGSFNIGRRALSSIYMSTSIQEIIIYSIPVFSFQEELRSNINSYYSIY